MEDRVEAEEPEGIREDLDQEQFESLAARGLSEDKTQTTDQQGREDHRGQRGGDEEDEVVVIPEGIGRFRLRIGRREWKWKWIQLVHEVLSMRSAASSGI